MRRNLIIITLILAVTFISIGLGYQRAVSQEETVGKMPPPPSSPPRIDNDHNKIFDDLDERLRQGQAADRFDVIIVLNQSLDNLPVLKERYGSFTEKFQYRAINGFAVTLTKGEIAALVQDPIVKQIEFDDFVVPHLDTSQQWFGTAKARSDFGVDGNTDGLATYSKNDVVITILDTGIDPNHVDLDGGKIIGWKDVNNNQPTPYDETGPCGGHGTHVASIVAGEGEGNPAFKGVAPGAALVGVKVLSERLVQGTLRCTAQTSEIVAGVQWMIDNKSTLGIEIANMSLGASGCSNGTDSLSSIVNAAVNAGIIMAVSAGNEGPGPCTIGSPAAAENAITVGAMSDVTPGSSQANACGDNDLPNAGFYLACFSSRGPTADDRIKPDISSPGVFISAAKAGTTSDYIVYSGTSMSSPFTAGVAALMLDANPTLTPTDIKTKLLGAALDWGPTGKDVDYGGGRLQGYDAVKSAGGFTGNGPQVPSHLFISDSISGPNTEDFWVIPVTDTSFPIAITLVMPNWARFNDPDFDMELRSPAGTIIATSLSATRQETIGVAPATTGTYTLRVYKYRGSGPYFVDVSFGGAQVAISLTSDGTTPFGILPLGAARDTTSTGTNDVQTVRVDAGPVDLNIKTSRFSDGTMNWFLGQVNGPDQVVWEFSKDAVNWNIFGAENTLYSFAMNVSTGASQDAYFRLTMPSSSSSTSEFGATVTIVATSP